MTLVGILVIRDNAVIFRKRIAQVIGHALVIGDAAQSYRMTGAETGLKEVFDVAFDCTVLVDELLVVPDWAIDLCRTVHFRTPRAVLNESLLAIPTLTKLVLELGQIGNCAELNATIIADGEVASLVGCAFLGGDDDDTIGSTATIEGSSGCTFQYCHRLNVVRVDV